MNIGFFKAGIRFGARQSEAERVALDWMGTYGMDVLGWIKYALNYFLFIIYAQGEEERWKDIDSNIGRNRYEI